VTVSGLAAVRSARRYQTLDQSFDGDTSVLLVWMFHPMYARILQGKEKSMDRRRNDQDRNRNSVRFMCDGVRIADLTRVCHGGKSAQCARAPRQGSSSALPLARSVSQRIPDFRHVCRSSVVRERVTANQVFDEYLAIDEAGWPSTTWRRHVDVIT